MAAAYTEQGDADQAFEWLEKAYQQRIMKLVYLKASPEFDLFATTPASRTSSAG